MTQFVQLHFLASYPPSNPNRDDLGRPKTAVMGGHTRLRMSSQSLKRAWRVSEVFEDALSGHLGCRTKEVGAKIMQAFCSGQTLGEILEEEKRGKKSASGTLPSSKTSKEDAKLWAWKIAGVFVDKPGGEDTEETEDEEPALKTRKTKGGKQKKDKKSNVDKETLKSEQMVFYSTEEIQAIDALMKTLAKSQKPPTDQQLSSLKSKKNSAADLALFGRMLASSPSFNVEAAAQVAHAITVHKVQVEDDYFTAVDDLNRGQEDSGAGYIGEAEFAAGLFYLYLCVDCDLLVRNLNDDQDLAKSALAALTEAAATVAPSGKQNSYANRVRASYILAEKGSQQPRSLSVAFLKPVDDTDMLDGAITALKKTRDNMDKVYGACSDAHLIVNALPGEGSLKNIITFVKSACDG